jgi:hypothetical protein
MRTNDLERQLRRKGFEGKPAGGHVGYYLTLEGRRTGFRMHRSGRDIEPHDGRIRQMARELKVESEHLWALYDCSLDRAGLVQLLRDRGFTI